MADAPPKLIYFVSVDAGETEARMSFSYTRLCCKARHAFKMGLIKMHPLIVPFTIYIANVAEHMERSAGRAKCMALDPAKNKYAKYIRNIRTIQEYLIVLISI